MASRCHHGALFLSCLLVALFLLSGCSTGTDAPATSIEAAQWAASRSHGKAEVLRIAARFFDEDEPQNSASLLTERGRHLIIPPEVKKLKMRMTVLYFTEEFEVAPDAKFVNVPPECLLLGWINKPITKDQLPALRWFDGVELNTSEKNGLDAILNSVVALNPKSLVLSNCALRAKEIASINKMHGLQDLILRGVDVQQVGAFKPLPQLHRLDCKDGRPEEAIGPFVAKFENLDYLSLRGFLVDDAAVAAISQLKHLRVLDLPDTGLDDTQLQRILAHANLERLSVHNTAVTDAAAPMVGSQTDLRSLNLSRCAVSSVFAPHISKLKKLECVDVGKTDFDDDGVRVISNLPNLYTLGLTNTKITAKCLTHLPSLPALHTLSVDDNELPIEPLRTLHRKIPKCSIH